MAEITEDDQVRQTQIKDFYGLSSFSKGDSEAMLAHALTDIGLQRKINQDYVWETTRPLGNFPNLFILADGMGGPKGGDYASKYMTRRLAYLIRNSKDDNTVKVLRDNIKIVNREIYNTACSDPELMGMGTTLVVSTIINEKLIIANVGDSRLYCIGDGIEQITRDHSYVEEQVALGRIVRDSEEYRLNKRFLTRAVGVEPRINVDIFERELLPKELVLMCSDGLTNMIDDDEIFSVMSDHGSLAYKVSALIDMAYKKGASDNIAVVLINPELEREKNV